MKDTGIKIFKSREILANALAEYLAEQIQRLVLQKDKVFIALSGGSTPSLLFKEMLRRKDPIDWTKVGFFWVDERCVPPDHPESNFGTAKTEFLEPMGIPASSYLRIRGEDEAETEALRYANLIFETLPSIENVPVFDIILLGMGADGHTASIFPDQIGLWAAKNITTLGIHPDTGQKRVSFTGKLINAASQVIFMVSGKEKAAIVGKIIGRSGSYLRYPASLVKPDRGELFWYLDEEAAGALV